MRGRGRGALTWTLLALVGPALSAQTAQKRLLPRAKAAAPERVEARAVDRSPDRRASDAALALQQEGRWEESHALLKEALDDCCEGSECRRCRLLLSYSLGYGYQLQYRARTDPSLLRRAEASYLQVLEEEPEHRATLKSLAAVYRAQGDDRRAIGLLERSVYEGPDRLTPRPGAGAEEAMMLGDLLAANDEGDKALRAFRTAAELDPDSAAARRRIVNVYRQLDAARAADLMAELEAWADRFPEVGRRGYALIVEWTWREAPELAGRALASYVGLLAAHGWVSPKLLAGLPEEWPPARDLHGFLSTGEWSGDLHRILRLRDRDLQARLAHAVGNRWLAAGQPTRTEECWSRTIVNAPDHEMGSDWLDLFADLAALYADRPELDPLGDKFARLEDRLFGGKGEAYRTNDLEAIQRFHTVLGLIYAHRGQWRGGRFRNGIFQLSSAIRFATLREERDEAPYQPQARLKMLLADGYREIGSEKAYAGYLGAAHAYLDLDDLDTAGELLERARSTRGGSDQAMERQLARVLEVRQAVRQDPARACPGVARDLAATPPAAFPARQRFKTLADCAAAGPPPGDTREFSSAALATAVESKITLIGAADLLRLEKLQADLHSGPGRPAALAPGSYRLQVSGGRGLVTVEVPTARELAPSVYFVGDKRPAPPSG